MNTHADKSQGNKSQPVANTIAPRKSGGEPAFQFVDYRPEAVAQRKLQEMANSSPQVSQLKRFQYMINNSPKAKQATQLQEVVENTSSSHIESLQRKENKTSPKNLSSNEVVQRVVAPSFARKRVRAPGTAIPTNASGNWNRPDWLRGESDAVQTLIDDLIAAGKVRRSPENPANIFDVYTGTWVSIIGVSIDHIVDWAQFARRHGVVDYQQLEQTYHEMDNLLVSGSRVNSGMVQTDPLEYMAGPAHERMLSRTGNPRGHERLGVLMEDLIRVDPDMTIQSIQEDRRQEFLTHLGIIQNPRDGATMTEPIDPLRLLMAFRDARHIAGAEAFLPMDRNAEDDAEAMDEDL